MKTKIQLFALLIFIDAKANAQWQPDLRLTVDSANSVVSFNNAWCVASKTEINLKNISAGMYFVKVFDGEKQYNKKLIVEHD